MPPKLVNEQLVEHIFSEGVVENQLCTVLSDHLLPISVEDFPEITPVFVSSFKPLGSEGDIVQ